MTRYSLMRFVLLLLAGALSCASAVAISPAEYAQAQADRAAERVERLRQGYAAGAVSRKDLEEAEEELREARRRLRDASRPAAPLTAKDVKLRVEDAQADWQKAAARARKLEELYEAGVVAHNDVLAAQATAAQAETFLKLNQELARHVELLESLPQRTPEPVGVAGFSARTFFQLQDEFYREFRQPLPISAFGPSETHEKMGFDHDGRVDIALHPDSAQGRWLITELELRRIPFLAFRAPVPGKATGPHIHLGFPSPPLARAD
jgi:hypothetical protein